MAIYHLSAKIITRAAGRSVVAAAAYRSGESLDEDSTGITFDYTRKAGIEHTEILAPEGAPAWVHDRSLLWNGVERCEKRKDAQLAREIEVGLPIELSKDEQLALMRQFLRREFVSRGMIADLAIHRDDPNNPHAHVLLTMRSIGPDGFGPKERSWNDRARLQGWRAAWEEITNEHLARAGIDARIDHRSLKDQGLDLVPGRKIGVGQERQQAVGLPHRIAERVAEQKRIAHENGERFLADPALALKAITHHQATFTDHDVARFLHTRTEGAEQFQAVYLKVMADPQLIRLGQDDRGRSRFTSQEMLQVEQDLLGNARSMVQRGGHAVSARHQNVALSQGALSEEQRGAFVHLVERGDLKSMVGLAGSGKSHLLAAAREAWEAEGFTVKGGALSGIAAENLELASGIQSRTLASYEFAWAAGRDALSANDVLVLDEAGLIGTRQMGRILARAQEAGAKVVMVGDPEQLQAIEAGAAFRGVMAESGVVELHEVRRQSQDWQREATRELASGETAKAVQAYVAQGAVAQRETREEARAALLQQWLKDDTENPKDSRLILAYTRDDVRQLNEAVRAARRERGDLGRGEVIQTERGAREFAAHDRLYFLRNEKSLGVKNGSLGTVEQVKGGILQVKLDTGHRVAVDSRDYRDLDHGYAATVYKAQGVTVDRTYVLATQHYDRHSTYVALSRQRVAAHVFYAREDFTDPRQEEIANPEQAQHRLLNALSRARPKELAHDYLERPISAASAERSQPRSAEDVQKAAREAWLAMRAKHESLSMQEMQAEARDRWQAYRQGAQKGAERDTQSPGPSKDYGQDQEL